MMKGFIFICSIVAVVYLFNVIVVIINICIKKRSWKSIARINPYKFFIKVFWNRNDGFGTDMKVGIIPIICTIMTFIGLWSIISNIIYWLK
ncbi:MAG: hypothetical protein K0S01_168 [Herbinix sp.]|jgi:ABC-type phosphate transport system permease subunit|nr:hypothetical protein [Herbinix sp.]